MVRALLHPPCARALVCASQRSQAGPGHVNCLTVGQALRFMACHAGCVGAGLVKPADLNFLQPIVSTTAQPSAANRRLSKNPASLRMTGTSSGTPADQALARGEQVLAALAKQPWLSEQDWVNDSWSSDGGGDSQLDNDELPEYLRDSDAAGAHAERLVAAAEAASTAPQRTAHSMVPRAAHRSAGLGDSDPSLQRLER